MLDLISAYENYLTKVKQASANTVFSYLRDIRQFSEWLRVYADIKNTGDMEASEVIQVYLHARNASLLKPEKVKNHMSLL